MCLLAFIALDTPISEIPWSEENPGLHVTTLGEHNEPIRSAFSKPHVFYVGSHEGCGCGFRHVWGPPGSPVRELTPAEFRCGEPEDPAVTRSTADLVALLRAILSQQGSLQVYSCWDGNQSEPPAERAALHSADLADDTFYLLEDRFLEITSGAV